MKLVSSLAALALVALPAAPASATPLTLKAGTAITLATTADLSSRDAEVGDPVDLVVSEPVVVDGVTVIPKGARATGEVSRAKGNGHLGKSGKLSVRVDHVTAEGQSIPVRGQHAEEGRSGTLGVVGAAVVFLPLGALIKGKEAKIPAGSPLEVYVAQDVALDSGAMDERAAQADVTAPETAQVPAEPDAPR